MTSNNLTQFARNLRENQTDAEKLLWSRLRNRQVEDAKFVRQFPIAPYITDFACRTCKLAIELDGGQHADNGEDDERTMVIEAHGFRVIRFWNNDVLGNIEGVLATIAYEVRLARNTGN